MTQIPPSHRMERQRFQFRGAARGTERLHMELRSRGSSPPPWRPDGVRRPPAASTAARSVRRVDEAIRRRTPYPHLESDERDICPPPSPRGRDEQMPRPLPMAAAASAMGESIVRGMPTLVPGGGLLWEQQQGKRLIPGMHCRTPLPPGGSVASFSTCSVQQQPVRALQIFSVGSSKRSMKAIPGGRSWRILSKVVRRTNSAHSEDTMVTQPDIEDDTEECEVVLGKELKLGKEPNEFAAHLAEPVKNRNGSGVLLLSDVEGLRNEDTRAFAYRLACFGYSVLMPDLFRGQPWEPETMPKSEYESWRALHSPERVAADIDTSTAFLESVLSDKAAPGDGRIAVLGFCFGGGRLIETLAKDANGLYSAGVFFYGTRFDVKLAASIQVPLLLITGENDPLCPVDAVEQVQALTQGSKALVFPGRGHAFAHHPKSMEDDEDAERAFEAAKKWLHDHLLAGADGPWAEGSDEVARS